MSSLITNATIQIRKDTAGNWTSNNPTPAAGEWCLETDTGRIKTGDGSTAWTSLHYLNEYQTAAIASVTSTFPTPATMASLILNPGAWLLNASMAGYFGVRPASGIATANIDFYDGSVVQRELISLGFFQSASALGDIIYISGSLSHILIITAVTTISFRITCKAGSGTPTNATAISRASGEFNAVRLR